jgi:hypothetical protein
MNCRSARSRRIKAAERRGQANSVHSLSPEAKRISQVVRNERDDVVDEMVREELRPAVREAITQDVLNAIRDMVALTPAAVAAITEDLASDDKVLRQRAYSLLTKYTLGHPALVTRDNDPDEKQLIVNFALPRPPDAPAIEGSATSDEELPEGQRACDLCGGLKDEDQFVDGSDRCNSCWAEQRAQVQARFADED